MDKIQELAVDLAGLSNQDLHDLAGILVRDYPIRADVLETIIGAEFYESNFMVV